MIISRRNTEHIVLSVLFFVLGILTVPAQQSQKIDKADRAFKHLAYIDASSIYLDVAHSGFRSVELFSKLGDTYYFNAKYQEAAKWYRELFSMTQDLNSIYFLRYAQSLKSIGLDEKAAEYYNQYLVLEGISGDAQTYMDIVEINSGRYQIANLPFNSAEIDFGATKWSNKLLFSSTRDSKTIFKTLSSWDGLTFLDIFEVSVDSSGAYGTPEKIKGAVNTKYHESTPVITKDGKTMYFTRNNKEKHKDNDSTIIHHLKIYRAHLVEDRWEDVEELSINGEDFSTAHPALSPDEKTLYFVSDRPESIGETDIFYAPINTDGTFGKIVNLGNTVNTRGRESFPFIATEGALYFSSDGHFGLGAYDVYYIKLNAHTPEGSLLNLGAPINSTFDDFAYVIHGNTGYFSSNRLDDNSEGYDNIYSFIQQEPVKDIFKPKIFGIVTDANGIPIADATVAIMSQDNTMLASVQTDADGYYKYTDINAHKNYILKADKPTYTNDDTFSRATEKDREHNFILAATGAVLVDDKEVIVLNVVDDIAKILNMIIYFDYNRYNIRSDATVELEKLVSLLKQNPNVMVDIRSYTDSRGNDFYNLALSEDRARATREYLLGRGIAPGRVTAKGYGETELLNNCYNGVPCSEAQHQENRRSEFLAGQYNN